MSHTLTVRRCNPTGSPTLYRATCGCGIASPWAASRQVAELAVERHEFEVGMRGWGE